MKLDAEAIRRRCRARGVPLTTVLRDAGVSRTAYYALSRRDSVLPKTVLKLAAALDAPPSEFLDERSLEELRARRRLREAKRVALRNPGSSFENIWHTLVLLEETPLTRLNRALLRGRTVPV